MQHMSIINSYFIFVITENNFVIFLIIFVWTVQNRILDRPKLYFKPSKI